MTCSKLFALISLGFVVFLGSLCPVSGSTCTGAPDCTACSTCGYCKHCAKEGGTCGVKEALLAQGGIGNAAASPTPSATPLPHRFHPFRAAQPIQPPRDHPAASGLKAEKETDYQTALLSLSDPAKLGTLGERGANPRLKKIVYWLDYARKAGRDPGPVLDEILQKNGYPSEHARLIKINLLRNIKIGDELGFFTPENLALLRSGGAPRVMTGPYAGDIAHVDHIIPVSLVPEIGNDLANLELMPSTLNLRKSAKIGERQKGLARDLRAAGVISESILSRVQSAKGAPTVDSL